MNKTLLVIALAVFGFANAQKGTTLVQGTIGYNFDKSSMDAQKSKSNLFQFAPKVGYQFADNWTVGIAANVTTGNQTTETDYPGFEVEGFRIQNENKSTSLGAGAFVRYTKPLSEVFSVYADLDAGFVNTKYTYISSDPFTNTNTTHRNSVNGFYAGITPAVYINVYKNFGLNFDIGGLTYGSSKFKDGAQQKTSAFSFNFGEAFNVGISKNF